MFFAFLCLIVWWLAENSFKDELSKKSFIPGFKVVMLIFAFILVLVDVYMFVETNRLIAISANSINGSCVSYTGESVFYPSQMAAATGTLLSGSITSLAHQNDGDIATFNEAGGSPGTNVSINFTSASDFSILHFRGRTDHPGGTYNVYFLRNDGVLVSVYAFSDTVGYIDNTIAFNGSAYVNGTNILAYVSNTGAGNLSSKLYLDWFVVSGNQTYNSYCSDTDDTRNIFIFHQMESDMMFVILSILPFLAMLIFAVIVIQVLLLIASYFTGKKNGVI